MSKKPINEVLAANLAQLMAERQLSQNALARRCNVAQTTISNYLDPNRRPVGKSGKLPSAKLTEVEILAEALDVEVWELLRPLSASERNAYKRIETAFKELMGEPDAPTKQQSYRELGEALSHRTVPKQASLDDLTHSVKDVDSRKTTKS